MNCASRVLPHFRDRPNHTALWTLEDGQISFGELGRLATGAQALALDAGLKAGDTALVLARPGPLLFAAVVGLLGLGVVVVFVEPWLPVRDIEHVLQHARPKAFIGSRLAQLWALRVPAARRIPRWIHIGRIEREYGVGSFMCPDLDPDAPGTITFTSGTTGRPKGLVRSHGCIWNLHEIITDGGRRDPYEAPELCIFPNLALLHLGSGRGAVLVPSDWSSRSVRRVAHLSADAEPASLTCGPAFLIQLLRSNQEHGVFGGLRSITVGGAQTDCWILERGFERWPEARWTHVYGGAEAEPVALVDAREAVRLSRARGRFQTLFLGDPVEALQTDPDPDGLWVSGPNVATRCLGGMEGGRPVRRTDENGREWHCMGDRISADKVGWWYGGRAVQPAEDFELEQRIYADLGTSACFVHRQPDGRLLLYGEGLTGNRAWPEAAILRCYPTLDGIQETRIVRDRRHRARIDRGATLAKGGHDGS
ncbi:MAG: AMP-binding protein [Gemmatimonadota bacterium]